MDSFFDLDNLPEEILERIFSFTSSYNDYFNLSLVSKKFHRLITELRIIDLKYFNESLTNGNITWHRAPTAQLSPSERHSHSCCRINNNLYLFGGLSGTCTAYNDLWMLNLDRLTWSKPKTDGKYPSPKAAASLVSHNHNSLILFGGYSHPYQYAINQQVNFYNELHLFSTRTHLWTSKVFVEDVPKLAGHSASLINQSHMIIFGGCVGVLTNKTNQVWCLSIDESELKWLRRHISGPEPLARYGHAQINIDNERLLIVGGCGGPNQLFEDVWILVWPCDMALDAFWQRVTMMDPINGPAQLHCVALVRCGEKIVTLGKPKKQKLDEKDVKCVCSSGTNGQNAFSVADSEERSDVAVRDDTAQLSMSKAQRNKIKRLEVLQHIASRYKKSSTNVDDYRLWKDSDKVGKAPSKCLLHSKSLHVFVMDFEKILRGADLEVRWLEPISAASSIAPAHTVLFSLSKGINELLLFGGMEIDSPNSIRINSTDNDVGAEQPVRDKIGSKLYVMRANGF